MQQGQDVGAILFASDSRYRGWSRTRLSPLVWLNVLCLDAPIVAVTWQWLFARSFHIQLAAPSRITLFLTAWLIYLADRLVDSSFLRQTDPKSVRQLVCQNHRHTWIGLLIGSALVDAWMVMRHLDAQTIEVGLLVGFLAFSYLAANWWGRIWQIIPAKEICIGGLFAIGTMAAFIPRIEVDPPFLLSLFFFAVLCSFNCMCIAVWERELDWAQNKTSIATRFPFVAQHLRISGLIIGVLSAVIAAMSGVSSLLFVCLGLSAFLLAALDLMKDVIGRDERTALADVVLFTPLILLGLGVLV